MPTATRCSPTETVGFVYDNDGEVLSASDENFTAGTTATDSYTYDAEGNVLTDTQQIPGLTPTITLQPVRQRRPHAACGGHRRDQRFRQQLSVRQSPRADEPGQPDEQRGQCGCATKTATFQYDAAGELTGVGRYQNADATANLVAQATYGYDGDGNLTSLVYTKGESTLRSYSWTYNAVGDMLTAHNNTDGTVNYGSDSTGQLTSASGGPAPASPTPTTPTATARR